MDALILLLPVLLLLWLVLRGRKQQRAVADLQSSLVPGQRVMTTSGLHAVVVEVGATTVVLEPADGVRTTWARAAVARTLADSVAEPAPAGRATTPDPAVGGSGKLDEAPERPER